ncbi:hypothetical protein M9435_001802 [Picochlorum sp. BPE23]|nr:hypothetical protein M9435_001802 [Picochlorum sp. BPE23]
MRSIHGRWGGVSTEVGQRVTRSKTSWTSTCVSSRWRCPHPDSGYQYSGRTRSIVRCKGEHEEPGMPRHEEGEAGPSPGAVGQEIMRLLTEQQSADQDALIQYLPDALIDAYISRYGGTNTTTDSTDEDEEDINVFQTCLANAPSGEFQINSYSWRGLLFAPPMRCDLISTLQISEGRFMQRYFVVSQHGEEMIISLDFRLEETLKSQYRGIQVETNWFLHGMSGEPVHMYESTLDNTIGPECVVEAQLNALKEENIEEVFMFASPRNKKIFDNDITQFEAMLRTSAYQSLLRHRESKILKSVQVSARKSILVVGIVAADGTKNAHVWVCALQKPNNVWMVDAVNYLN